MPPQGSPRSSIGNSFPLLTEVPEASWWTERSKANDDNIHFDQDTSNKKAVLKSNGAIKVIEGIVDTCKGAKPQGNLGISTTPSSQAGNHHSDKKHLNHQSKGQHTTTCH